MFNYLEFGETQKGNVSIQYHSQLSGKKRRRKLLTTKFPLDESSVKPDDDDAHKKSTPKVKPVQSEDICFFELSKEMTKEQEQLEEEEFQEIKAWMTSRSGKRKRGGLEEKDPSTKASE